MNIKLFIAKLVQPSHPFYTLGYDGNRSEVCVAGKNSLPFPSKGKSPVSRVPVMYGPKRDSLLCRNAGPEELSGG